MGWPATLRVVGRRGGKRTVNLVHGHRLLLQLDVWQLPDGTWTARQWEQCID